MENFYEQLKSVCKEYNTTVYAIEKATGASKGSFIKWRTSSPSADKLIEIADLFGVSMDYLLGREISTTKKVVPMERPDSNIATIENIKALLAENDGINIIERLYKELQEKQKIFVLTWLIGYMASEGLPVKKILGR